MTTKPLIHNDGSASPPGGGRTLLKSTNPLVSKGYGAEPCAFAPERSVKPPLTGGENPGTGVLEAFEDWCDRQTFPVAVAEHADRVINYLRMAIRRPLPTPLLRALAEHVEAIRTWRL